MKALQNLLSEFDATDAYIQSAREILHGGHMPDMTGLGMRVADLCAAVANAEPEAQRECRPKLMALLRKLDICEKDLQAFRARTVPGEIRR